MSKAIIFLTDGFEEIEAITTADILRRAGIEAELMSVTGSLKVKGSHDITVTADKLLDKNASADMLILPGGQVVEAYLNNPDLGDMLQNQKEKGKYIAAICAAPTALGKMGLLDDTEATCYPTLTEQLTAKTRKADAVVTDSNIITGRSPGVSAEFALKLAEVLTDKDTAESVKANMYF